MKHARTLRILQIGSIVLVLFCLFMTIEFPAVSNQGAMTLVQWFALLGALYCAVDGFYMQRKILRGPRNPRTASKSTPVGRWMVGNVMRIAFATATSLWGFLLHSFGGQDWLARLVIGLGLILLLIWRPGTRPVQEQ